MNDNGKGIRLQSPRILTGLRFLGCCSLIWLDERASFDKGRYAEHNP